MNIRRFKTCDMLESYRWVVNIKLRGVNHDGSSPAKYPYLIPVSCPDGIRLPGIDGIVL